MFDLEIEKIELSHPYDLNFPLKNYVNIQHIVNVEIKVINNSENKNYFIISDLRKLYYDVSTDTLYIHFSEETPPPINVRIPESIVLHNSPPKTILIRHSDSQLINGNCPLIIKRIILDKSNKIDIEESNIMNLKHIVCNIAYNQMQLAFDKKESGKKRIDRILEWSKYIQKTFDMTIPK